MIGLLAVAAVATDVGEARACLPLDHGALVGTAGGLVELADDGSIVRVRTALDGLPGTRIDSIVQLGDKVWIGTDAGGTDGTHTFHSPSVRGFAQLGTTTYAATWDGGVIDVATGAMVPFRAAAAKGARIRVAAIAVAGGTLYAGTAGGLYKLVRGKLERVDEAPVSALLEDAGQLWVATPGQVHGPDTPDTNIASTDPRALAVVGSEIVIADAVDGLRVIDRGRTRAFDGPNGGAQAIAAGHGGLCVGSLTGASVRRDGKWIAAAHRDGPPSNDISALAVVGDKLYVGTFDRGLAIFDGAWRTFSSPELDARINAIFVDDGRVYVGTAEGLAVIHGADVRRLTKRDGLPGRGVLAIGKAHDGILVGTSQGAVLLGDGHPVRLGPKGDAIGNVWAVAEDGAGNLLLGTATGLYRGRDDHWQRFSAVTRALANDWVTALAVRGETVYIGTYSGGIVSLTGDATRQLAPGWVNPGGLTFVDDVLYAATQEGLRVVVGSREVPHLPGKDVTAVAVRGGRLVVGTRRGIML
jgi:hypothetical protein